MLTIKNLKAGIEGTEILHGVNLQVEDGVISALMGQNGSGKSTLAQSIMGHPAYEITSGDITFNGKSLKGIEPNEKATLGIFLSFQYPSEISGVTISSYLRLIYNKAHASSVSPVQFRKILKEKMDFLEMHEDFSSRYLNEGFSGGEKKRMEMLQMLLLEPKLALLDETDSGLDVDALKTISKAVDYLNKEKKMAAIVITH
jgi:Fe-S cluster assembly ATP-binding protein